MRSLLITIIGLITISAHASPPITLPILDENVDKFDMMVTGVSISDAHKERWHENHQKISDCPECALEQPFPDDIEVSED